MMHKLTNGNYSATKVAANDAENGVHGERFFTSTKYATSDNAAVSKNKRETANTDTLTNKG